ncbi:MAG: hypothetical protein GF417_03975 [Candidatus Latescibacteria bacterium]|nr:hypothetical protein [bacterium]MBD3423584.1 hypothetical protein [Candidatus Latescibacterota bacterium]
MPDDKSDNCPDMGLNESGYSIPLKKDEVLRFFEEGDLSSGNYLSLFENVGSELNSRIKSEGGASFLALSVDGERETRNFTVLQISHYLSRMDRNVLIVDCDFLEPGLSGMIEKIEDYGFLDLLLYGSSLKSVAKPSGIDNVGIIGPGSFPVTKTVPFARKEFSRINGFLTENSDAVIYCSTLNTDDGQINPLAEFVDGILLSCRIEETQEGELQKSVSGLESAGVKTIETVCLCSGEGAEAVITGEAATPAEEQEEEDEAEEIMEEEEAEAVEEVAETGKETTEPAFIEKTEELDSGEREPEKKFDLFRLAAVIVGVLVVAFVVWWFMWGSIKKDDRSSEIASEAVRKMKDVREDLPGEDQLKEDGTGEQADEDVSREEDRQEPAGVSESAGEHKLEAGKQDISFTEPAEYYAVHVASFRDSSRALREKKYFEDLGYLADIREAEIKNQKWYRILIGRFDTAEEAGRKRIELKGVDRVGYARVRKVEVD